MLQDTSSLSTETRLAVEALDLMLQVEDKVYSSFVERYEQTQGESMYNESSLLRKLEEAKVAIQTHIGAFMGFNMEERNDKL